MSLLVQFKCLFYCFMYGVFFTCVYHVVNRIMYRFYTFIRIVLQVILGIIFSYCFYKGLIYINNGALRIYFFIFVFLGYVFFQRYYSYILLYYLEKGVKIYKGIISPYIFFFKKIDVIMKKKVKWVKNRWQKRKNSNSQN